MSWRGRVTCIDADPNRTLAQVLRLTKEPLITCVESDSDRLLADLRHACAESDLVVIDLEGTANQAMLYAAGKSDLVLVPAQPSRFDVVEAVKTVGVVRKAADLVGREIAHRVVLSRTPVLRQRVADHSRAQFVRAGLPLLPVELVQRGEFGRGTKFTGRGSSGDHFGKRPPEARRMPSRALFMAPVPTTPCTRSAVPRPSRTPVVSAP